MQVKPLTPFNTQDYDNDGILNGQDNCPNDYNPNQEDIDEDGVGDLCDSLSEVDDILQSEEHIYLDKMYFGIIMQSSDGNCWITVVRNDGSLHTLSVVCPN